MSDARSLSLFRLEVKVGIFGDVISESSTQAIASSKSYHLLHQISEGSIFSHISLAG